MNVDAVLAAITSDVYEGDARYEELFAARSALIAENFRQRTELSRNIDRELNALLDILATHFSEMPDDDQRELAQEMVHAIITNPIALDDYSQRQLSAIEDVVVNVAIIRTLIYSYEVRPSDDNEIFVDWMARYLFYFVP